MKHTWIGMVVALIIGLPTAANAQSISETEKFIKRMIEKYTEVECTDDAYGPFDVEHNIYLSVSFKGSVMTLKETDNSIVYRNGQYDESRTKRDTDTVDLAKITRVRIDDDTSRHCLQDGYPTLRIGGQRVVFAKNAHAQMEKVKTAVIHLAKLHGAEVEDDTLNEDLF